MITALVNRARRACAALARSCALVAEAIVSDDLLSPSGARAGGVSSGDFGVSGQQPIAFVDYLPGEFAEIERDRAITVGYRPRPPDDACGYETAHDAVVDAKAVGSRLLHHVEPQDLLFVFAQTFQAANQFPFALALRPCPQDAPRRVPYEDDTAHEYSDSKNWGVIFCKLRHPQSLKDLRRAKEQDSRDRPYRCVAGWAELESIQQRLEPLHGHHASLGDHP